MSVIEDIYNKITLKGTVSSEIVFSHKVYGEEFVKFEMSIMRISGAKDIIPVIVSKRIPGSKELETGEYIRVDGQIRTYNRMLEGKNRLIITVFAKELEFIDDDDYEFDENYVFLEGYVCRKPFYRISPRGREITDLMVAVNRMYGKSDYIPCIAWGRNAKYACMLEVGTKIRAVGRIQSREYRKRLSDTEIYKGVAREISIHKIEEI